MSLEQPNSPQIFLDNSIAPTVDIEVNLKAERCSENIFECVITSTITTKAQDKIVFLIEAKQAGVFEIRNVPEQQIEPALNITCPAVLFPYLRSNIADVITRAGFPPIHLADINFQALYEQRRAAQQSNEGQTANETAQQAVKNINGAIAQH